MFGSNVFFVIFIALAYGVWQVLDYLGLPNTFAILLILLTALCAGFWCYYRFVVTPKRKRQIKRVEQRRGMALTEEEKQQILPVSENGALLASLFPVLAVVFLLRSFVFEPFQIPSGSMEPTLRVGDFLLVEKYAYGIKDPVFQKTLIETGKPKHGDIIVFKAPHEPNVDYIKRVIGLPGDKIYYNEINRHLTVVYSKNGEECREECVTNVFKYSQPEEDPDFNIIIGQDRQGKPVYSHLHPLKLKEQGDVTHDIHWDNQPSNMTYLYQDYQSQQDYITEWVVPQGAYFVMGDNRDHSLDSRFWGFVPERNIVGKARYIWLSLDKRQGEFPTGIRMERMFTKIQ